MVLVRAGPYVTIRGKVGAHTLQRLPGKFDSSILGSIKVGPVKGRSVASDLGRVQQVVQDPVESVRILQGEVQLLGVSKRADEMDVREL